MAKECRIVFRFFGHGKSRAELKCDQLRPPQLWALEADCSSSISSPLFRRASSSCQGSLALIQLRLENVELHVGRLSAAVRKPLLLRREDKTAFVLRWFVAIGRIDAFL